jgi:hypothetical protein
LEEQLYGALLPDAYGGKRLRGVLDELYRLVMADPAAPHFITIATTLNQEEMAYLVSGVEQFLLEEGGDVHVMINPCFPVVSPHTDSAQALVCDFRGGKGVRAFLKAFLLEEERQPQADGITWEELREIAAQVPERESLNESTGILPASPRKTSGRCQCRNNERSKKHARTSTYPTATDQRHCPAVSTGAHGNAAAKTGACLSDGHCGN